MKKEEDFTGKEKLFVQEYLKDMNGSAAVVRAGYSAKYANRYSSEILKKPHIRSAINSALTERAKDTIISVDYVLNRIVKTINKAETDNNHTAVLRGLEMMARHLGMFVEKHEITGKDGEAIKYQKVQEDAAAFSSAIDGLIARSRTKITALESST